jgi:predicted Zn-dependent peptidase
VGNSILGIEKHIKSFTQKDIVNFMQKAYNVKDMIWVVASSLDEETVLKMTEKYFLNTKFNGTVKRIKPSPLKKAEIVVPKPNSQYHFIMGQKAFSLDHKNRHALILLNNILGGPGMSSRLSMNIREKYGYTYSIESGYHSLSDTGIFHIYFATEKKYFEKTKNLVFKELDKMRNEKLTEKKLNNHKQQLIGQITMSQENKMNVMLAMAKNTLYFNRIYSLKDITDRINAITLSQFTAVTNEILDTEKMSSLIYEPLD